MIDLRQGDWRDVLTDVECDTLICDPPYSKRTHKAYSGQLPDHRGVIDYRPWDIEDVVSFVDHWHPRTRGWFVAFCDHALVPIWHEALASKGRYVFSPISCVETGSTVRISGDGPTQWSVMAIVARPRKAPYCKWGALPGAYVGKRERKHMMGAKPLWLMRSIVRDYSRPGDVICDPCAGSATTLLAAALEDRLAVGAEMDPNTHALAMGRLSQALAA